MKEMDILIGSGIAIAGLVAGGVIAWLILGKRRETERQMQRVFEALSLDALSKSSQQFLQLAHETLAKQTEAGKGDLETKKQLIDQQLGTMNEKLESVKTLMSALEMDRQSKFGELNACLSLTQQEAKGLRDVTNRLTVALSGTKTRGQWGERMAEDLLSVIGLQEGINYLKQKTTEDEERKRPDFTFLLPNGIKLNMDVKFPLSNYLLYHEAPVAAEQERYRSQFLKDVRARIAEVAGKNYINPPETLDYALAFIPNDQVFSFLMEGAREEGSLLDFAFSKKVVLCSPITLYAILSIIHKSVENFQLERSAKQIQQLFADFTKEWKNFKKCFEEIAKSLDEAHEAFSRLRTTRALKLDTQLERISALRIQGIAEPSEVLEESAEGLVVTENGADGCTKSPAVQE
jgi:DNA recombination protein RmuC